jgi:hypothetical protein
MWIRVIDETSHGINIFAHTKVFNINVIEFVYLFLDTRIFLDIIADKVSKRV